MNSSKEQSKNFKNQTTENNKNEMELTNAEFAREYAHEAMHCFVYGNYEAAIEDFTKSIELRPNSPDCYYYRGCSYKKLKQYDLALKDIQTAIEMNPKDYLYKKGLRELKKQI